MGAIFVLGVALSLVSEGKEYSFKKTFLDSLPLSLRIGCFTMFLHELALLGYHLYILVQNGITQRVHYTATSNVGSVAWS